MKKLLCLLGVCIPLLSMDPATITQPDWITIYGEYSTQLFPSLNPYMDTIKNKAKAHAINKNRLHDEEYIKLLFMHYLVITQIDEKLLNEAE